MEERLTDFVRVHGLSYCHALAFVIEQLQLLDRLAMDGASGQIRKLSNDERQIAAVLLASKLIFNKPITENLDISHFLDKLYTGQILRK